MTSNTRDLSKFGQVEREHAAELLKLYGSSEDESNLNGGVEVEFNPNSGMVFLVDSDYNVAMEYEGKLVNWLSCPNCGNEDYQPIFVDEHTELCCKKYYNDMTMG